MSKKSFFDKFIALNEVVCDPELTDADKLVFQRLVWRLNLETGACFPSVGSIAEDLSMTSRGVRNCLARLERNGYLKRRIHAGRTKANDYLIPGLNTERRFPKTGTKVPEKRNTGSAQIRKEKEKEKEASEAEAHIVNVSPSCDAPQENKVTEEAFQNRLAAAFGGGEHGWAILINMPAEQLDELENNYRHGSMSFQDAVEVVRTGFLEMAAQG